MCKSWVKGWRHSNASYCPLSCACCRPAKAAKGRTPTWLCRAQNQKGAVRRAQGGCILTVAHAYAVSEPAELWRSTDAFTCQPPGRHARRLASAKHASAGSKRVTLSARREAHQCVRPSREAKEGWYARRWCSHWLAGAQTGLCFQTSGSNPVCCKREQAGQHGAAGLVHGGCLPTSAVWSAAAQA